MKRSKWSKLLAAIIAFVMIAAMLPIQGVFAASDSASASVTESISNDTDDADLPESVSEKTDSAISDLDRNENADIDTAEEEPAQDVDDLAGATDEKSINGRNIYFSERPTGNSTWESAFSEGVWVHAWNGSGSQDIQLTKSSTLKDGDYAVWTGTFNDTYDKVLFSIGTVGTYHTSGNDQWKQSVNVTRSEHTGNCYYIGAQNGNHKDVAITTITAFSLSASTRHINTNETATVTATLMGDAGSVIDWTSSNENVATVTSKDDTSATVTGLSDGTVTITATSSGGQTDFVTIYVGKIENAVYFDATLSVLSYSGDSGAKVKTGIPASENGPVYCQFAKSSSGSDATAAEEMVRRSDDEYVYFAQREDNSYTYVRFSATQDMTATNGQGTDWLEISSYEDPCFYADDSNDSIYSDSAVRSGYWKSVDLTRDPEEEYAAKGSSGALTKLDDDSFSADGTTYYVNASLYDYYSDYELNGTRLLGSGENGGTQRSYYRYRQFDQAESEAYKKAGTNSSEVTYMGHFQPFEGATFTGNIANDLGLYGYVGLSTFPNSFFSNNNSAMQYDVSGTWNHYSQAARGLVNPTLDGFNANVLGSGTLKTADGTIAMPTFDKEFLEKGENSKKTVLGKVYEDVQFPFTKLDRDGDGILYWSFDSAYTTLHLADDGTTKYLKSYNTATDSDNQYTEGTTSGSASSAGYKSNAGSRKWSINTDFTGFNGENGVSNYYGYFPLNDTSIDETAGGSKDYNYGFGTRLDFNFRLTEDGIVKDKNGNSKAITFNFSGDDDVWVFIDGKLVLDLGGEHGRTSGCINFAKNVDYTYSYSEGQSTAKTAENPVPADDKTATVSAATAFVSGAKQSYTSQSDNGSSVTTKLSDLLGDTDSLYTGTHTLTLFYMERGMWESNMKVQFNFPDDNSLIVGKKVDTDTYGVADDFATLLQNANFTFDIKNQSNHYGTAAAAVQSKTVSYADNFTGTSTVEGNNKVATVTDSSRGTVLQYITDTPNTDSNYTDSRWLHIAPDSGSSVDASDANKYLSFYLKFSNGGVPALSGLRLKLTANGTAIESTLAGLGQSSLAADTWVRFNINLEDFCKSVGVNYSDVDWSSVTVDFEGDSQGTYYLDDFKFKSAEEVTNQNAGFSIDQSSIADYGSSESGHLENADGALYTVVTLDNDTASGTDYSVTDGQFAIKDMLEAVFKNQFRRGSYIYLNENLPIPSAFETSWKLYDNKREVTYTTVPTSVSSQTTKAGYDAGTLSGNQKTTTISDGRIEQRLESDPALSSATNYADNAYYPNKTYNESNVEGAAATQDGTNSASTILFRTYSNPDSAMATLNLKAVVTNVAKTGSLLISKESLTEEERSGHEDDEFTFTVTFTNVAGLQAEGATPVTRTVKVKFGQTAVLTGIPVGTTYTIEETPATGFTMYNITRRSGMITADDGYKLDLEDNQKVDTTSAIENLLSDSNVTIADTSKVTVTNTAEISVDITKSWSEGVSDDDKPDTVYVELLRARLGQDIKDAEVVPQEIKDSSGNVIGYQDYIALKKDNNYALTVDHLPKSYAAGSDANGSWLAGTYTYYVKEVKVAIDSNTGAATITDLPSDVFVLVDGKANFDGSKVTATADADTGAAAITNTKVTAGLTLEKKWYQVDGITELTDTTNCPDVAVYLERYTTKDGSSDPDIVQYYSGDADGTNPSFTDNADSAVAINLTKTNNWKLDITGLDIKYSDDKTWNYKLYKEDSITGYSVLAYGDAVTLVKDKVSDYPTATVSNQQSTTGFTMTKIEEPKNSGDATKYLGGVQFELYASNDAGTEKTGSALKFTQSSEGIYRLAGSGDTNTVDTIVTAETSGTLTVSNLEQKVYWLVEKKAKDGYYLLKDPVKIDLIKGHSAEFSGNTQTSDTGKITNVIWTSPTLTFTLSNVPGVELPVAGGAGRKVLPWIIIGAALVAAAVVLKKRRAVK